MSRHTDEAVPQDEATSGGSSIPPRTKAKLEESARDSPLAERVFLPAQELIHSEGASGRLLIAAAIVGLILANSPLAGAYMDVLATELSIEIGSYHLSASLLESINSGLMTVFFLLVTLEVKREVVEGELSSVKRASLPAAAAVGGMVAPALIYLAVAHLAGPAGDIRGWGIPIATDIAFALAVAGVLGDRIPHPLLVFLLAFAIVDDIGAILVIAIFYSASISWVALGIAAVIVGVILLVQRLGLTSPAAYGAFGVLLWLAIDASGVHATIAGVILGLLIPSRAQRSPQEFEDALDELGDDYVKARRAGDDAWAAWVIARVEAVAQRTEGPLDRLERIVRPWSGLAVLPIFAFANAGIPLSLDGVAEAALDPVAIGIVLGFLVGKPVGVGVASWVAVRTGAAELPEGVRWSGMLGIAMLSGIGFTVAIFIADLAFGGGPTADVAKLAIFAATIGAAIVGVLILILKPVTDESDRGGQG